MIVLRRIWAIYGVLMFLLTMAVFGVPFLLFNMAVTPGEKALRRNIYFLYHIYTPLFLFLVGIRLSIKGTENLEKGQSYVIIGNHRSPIDFIVNAHSFPGIFQFLAKDELKKIPVFGWVVKKMCLTVDRKNAMSRARSVVNIKNKLAEGWSVFIYPEGGRNRTENPLAPFYDGAFRIAIQTGAPIAVQTVCNVQEISGSASAIDLWPGTLRIVWDEPIPTAGLKTEDIPALKARIEAIMLQHLQSSLILP